MIHTSPSSAGLFNKLSILAFYQYSAFFFFCFVSFRFDLFCFCFSCRFFLLILVYLIAGFLYNKKHKGAESFPEVIPNHSFWADFPFLVKVGTLIDVDPALFMNIQYL